MQKFESTQFSAVQFTTGLTTFLLTALTTGLVAGCNYHIDKTGNPGDPSGNTTTSVVPDFATVNNQVIGPKCATCHNGSDEDPPLNSYPAVKAKLDRVLARVSARTMPKRHPLEIGDERLLLSWLNAGGPEFTQVAQNPAPVPPTEPGQPQDPPAPPVPPPVAPPGSTPPAAPPGSSPPAIPPVTAPPGTSPPANPSPTTPPNNPPPAAVILPTYTSIRAAIFEPMCLRCHAVGGRADDMPFDTLQDLLAIPDLINLQDPLKSSLMVAVSRTDNKRMPPVKTGMPPLTQDQIDVLTEWIRQGTPQ